MAATCTRQLCWGWECATATAGYRCYSARILRQLDLGRIRAEGYGFQIEMTYRAKQHGAGITEVPISFVDRTAGESKMSSFIVVEALLLVSWWGLGRLVRGARGMVMGANRRSGEVSGGLAPPPAPPNGTHPDHTGSGAEDAVHSA